MLSTITIKGEVPPLGEDGLEEAHIQAEDRSSTATTWMEHLIGQGVREVKTCLTSLRPGIPQGPFFGIKKNYSVHCPTEKKQSEIWQASE